MPIHNAGTDTFKLDEDPKHVKRRRVPLFP